MSSALYFLTFSTCFNFLSHAYLTDVYTSIDKNYLLDVITSSQDNESGLFENSLTTTLFATEILSSMNMNINQNDILCSTLMSKVPKNMEQKHQIFLSRSYLKNCINPKSKQNAISDEIIDNLHSGLFDKKLSTVVYSMHIIHAFYKKDIYIKDQPYGISNFNGLQVLQHLLSFQNKKDSLFAETQSGKAKSSVYRSAMALIAVSQV